MQNQQGLLNDMDKTFIHIYSQKRSLHLLRLDSIMSTLLDRPWNLILLEHLQFARLDYYNEARGSNLFFSVDNFIQISFAFGLRECWNLVEVVCQYLIQCRKEIFLKGPL